MLRYTTDRASPGLVTFYDTQLGNGAGLFLQPRDPHGAVPPIAGKVNMQVWLISIAEESVSVQVKL